MEAEDCRADYGSPESGPSNPLSAFFAVLVPPDSSRQNDGCRRIMSALTETCPPYDVVPAPA